MLQLIISIIFIVSFVGVLFILTTKIPVLVSLPKNGTTGLKKPKLIAKLEKDIKAKHFHFFEKQMLLHKTLSLVKVWTLKAETKIDHLLHGIRKKAQELDRKKK